MDQPVQPDADLAARWRTGFPQPETFPGWLASAAIATAWAVTEDGLLILLTIAGVARTALDKPNDKPDNTVLAQSVALVAGPLGPGAVPCPCRVKEGELMNQAVVSGLEDRA